MRDTAIVVYVDNDEKSIIEFRWLYRSWEYSDSSDISDLIVFYNPAISNFEEYYETAQEASDPINQNVYTFPLTPLSEIEQEWAYYPHINASWFLTRPEASFLSSYKYLLKTDNDTFLTPNFPHLKPRLATFGTSAYASNPEVVNNLTRISEKWGIKQHFINIGCTIMAPGNQVLEYAKRQFEFCKRLKAEEFPDGEGQWPGWYLRVLNMYAGCLAANSLFGNSLTMGGLDVFCMSDDLICPTDYHIHAWHTDNFFSKLKWYDGEYDNMDFDKLNPLKISDYCLMIAGRRAA